MLKVIIVDDHSLVREGIRALLHKSADVCVVGEAADGRSALELVEKLLPDLVLMDLTMPVMNGVEATGRIAADHPEVRVLVLSMHDDPRYVSQAFRAGARGYLLKDRASAELMQAIRAVAGGELYLCPGVMNVVMDDYLKMLAEPAGPEVTLTPREREVLQLIAEGNNAKSIAFQLDINVKTVENHRKQIMKKLKLHTVSELTRYAIRTGVTSVHG